MKVQWTSMSFKSLFGVLVGGGGFWLGFGILILIWIWWLVYDTPMIQILALYLDFEDEKKIYVLLVMIWGFGGWWRFLTGYAHFSNLGSLFWFWRCKEHPCPLGPDWGLWRLCEVPDWGLGSCPWFEYGHLSLLLPYFEFCLNFEGVKNIHVLEVLIWGFGGHWRNLTWVWYLYLDMYMVTGLW